MAIEYTAAGGGMPMTTPFERMQQAQMSLKAAQQEAADAVAALKQQFGSFEISVNVNGKSIEIMLADQKSRTARLTMPMGVAIDVARYVLALAEHVPPESLEPPTPPPSSRGQKAPSTGSQADDTTP
jgi:hypothetical protein